MGDPGPDLPQGTLDMLILQVVALGPIHGYAIAQRIKQISREVLHVPQGSLYPALHRLENRGLLDRLLGCIRDGPRREVLSAHRKGSQPPEIRNGQLGAIVGSDRADSADGAGRCEMSWWTRLRQGPRLERELDAELRYHVERLTQDYMREGLSEAEARRRARLEFGGLDQMKEECRDARGTAGSTTSFRT